MKKRERALTCTGENASSSWGQGEREREKQSPH